MSNIAIQRVDDTTKRVLPIFEEFGKRFEEIRQRALELFEKRGREIGHALDDWLRAERDVLGGWPAAELREKDGTYELRVTLPGYEAGEVQVTAAPGEILIHAETKQEKKAAEGKVIWTEFGSNNVYRRFDLPQPIDVSKATATLERGLLRVSAAKAEVPKPKPIEIAA